jgi:transcriptional regulator
MSLYQPRKSRDSAGAPDCAIGNCYPDSGSASQSEADQPGMYSPKFNQVHDRGILLEAMRTYSFATLFGPVSNEPAATSGSATHLPLVVKDEGAQGLLEGHFAKANPHWQALSGRETLVVFAGPHSYVSPTLYVEELSMPAWNYIAVHAYGTLSLVDDDPGKEALLDDLIAANEPAFMDRWRAMPDGFRRTLLTGIIGFRIPIERIEGKFKLSQNRSPQERGNVHAAQSAGSPDERDLARWMERLLGSNLQS